jgi:rhomboid protease GluP
MESMALEVYGLPEGTPKDELLAEIKYRGIYYWNENIKLLDSFEKLDLPLEIRTRNMLLKEYCQLRINSYELLYKGISEGTDLYTQEIEEYNRQIAEKIEEIKKQ